MEVSNNGGFIAGITPENILHHQPVARNPMLVEALTRLRLVNRSNLGVGRMFSAFLIEGKRPPIINEIGESVTVTMLNSPLDAPFRRLIADIKDPLLKVDELFMLRCLWTQDTVPVDELAIYSHCTNNHVEEVLKGLALRGLVEPANEQNLTYWRMAHDFRKMQGREQVPASSDRLLKLIRLHPNLGLAMGDILQELEMSRSTAKRLLEEQRDKGLVCLRGNGRAARWFPHKK